jgi:type IV pilus assembly protein PilZ
VQDKRVHARVPIEVEVSCELQDGRTIAGVAKDISLGGMFIECPEALPFGTELTIIGQIAGISGETRLPGVVRWSKTGGIGVQFGLLGARETHAITRLLKS